LNVLPCMRLQKTYAVLAYRVQSEWSNEPLALLSAVMYCPVPNAVHNIRLMIVPCMHDTHVLDFSGLHMQCAGMLSACIKRTRAGGCGDLTGPEGRH